MEKTDKEIELDKKLCSAQTTVAYWEGVIAGIRMYAWWKNGVQYVGTTGRTLADATDEIKKAWLDTASEVLVSILNERKHYGYK